MVNQQNSVRGDKIEHRWRMMVHTDTCHSYSSTWVCQYCGAVLKTYDERDVNEDPFSMVWMERYDNEVCPDCESLLAGRSAEHRVEFLVHG